jgi:hypothetical protein
MLFGLNSIRPHSIRNLSAMPQTATAPNTAGDASEIGGYTVDRPLVPDQSWLVTSQGEAGRTLVLKTLDEDCLWKGQLHPNVKDRLARVRELAHAGVANLYGVERDAGLTYLVWEYTFGDTLDEAALSPTCTYREFLRLARELTLGVEMLHARGIVHGAIKASNVIVTPTDRRVVITHVSPLLYTDPGDDMNLLVSLLSDLAERRGESETPFGHLLAEVTGQAGVTPRRLATRIGALLDSRDIEPASADADQPAARRIRRRAMLGATATAILAVVLFVSMKQYAVARTPKAPKPPTATREALQAPVQSVANVTTPKGGL